MVSSNTNNCIYSKVFTTYIYNLYFSGIIKESFKKKITKMDCDKDHIIFKDYKHALEEWDGLNTHHYENTPMQHTAIFHARKNDNFHLKMCDFFLFLPNTLIVSTL